MIARIEPLSISEQQIPCTGSAGAFACRDTVEGLFEFMFGAGGRINRAKYWRSLLIFGIAGLRRSHLTHRCRHRLTTLRYRAGHHLYSAADVGFRHRAAT
jgi:hypothetical protein